VATEVDALAWSVAALAHEAQHVAGRFDEATAECHGMQSIAQAASMLGYRERDARYLATVYWKRFSPWLSKSYRSSECQSGGRLDMRPRDDRWP
jgi:hypothetical protein